jgi:phosphoserine phosphatase RsbU/P
MQWSYSKIREAMIRAGVWPQSRVARIACYLAGLAGVLFVLKGVLGLFAPSWSRNLGGWVAFLIFLAAVLFGVVGFRWLKSRILWRLRNRLIVTYMFIGVIPAVLLIAMTLITLYGLAGQFAIFVVTSEINSQLRSMQAVNAAVANELASKLERGGNPAAESLAGLRKRDIAWRRRRICAWQGDKLLPLDESKEAPLSLPAFAEGGSGELIRDYDGLHLRVATILPVGSKTLTVVTSEPFDKSLVSKIAADIGEISVFVATPPQNKKSAPPSSGSETEITDETTQHEITIRENGVLVRLVQAFAVGTVPGPSGNADPVVTFPAPLSVLDWHTGGRARIGALVQVRTRPSVLYGHLFAALGDFVQGVEEVLLAILVIFAVIELIALIIGTRMTRTVTSAVAQLDDATKHIDRGDFSHRIPVKSQDQLAQLSLSFNSMTESIEKLILEQKEKQRLEGELAIAQEVQEQLFPRQIAQLDSLEVHGFCRPARTVSGDYYDFLTVNPHKMILAMGDISGKGISAALLMATIHSAVRAYSVESLAQMREVLAVGAGTGVGLVMAARSDGIEIAPGSLLSLLNHQLYESTPPEKYATLFLAIYDGLTRRLNYSNGGHLPPLLISEDGGLRRLENGGTVVGLFDNQSYAEGSVEMHPGEILVAYSDGITEPENDFGEFGEERLIDLIRDNRHSPLAQISQTVTAAVDTWIGEEEQPDDVTIVLARAR